MNEHTINTTPHERHIVLVAPEVHWNTGNAGRTCLGYDAHLHLIKPLSFSLDDKHLKRAGLDYWSEVNLHVWDNFEALIEEFQPTDEEIALLTTRGQQPLWNITPAKRMFLIFGSETKGLPGEIHDRYSGRAFRIPTNNDIRCLNLSTSVGIALYESLRGLLYSPMKQI
jgi:tRNA (cytidine/uridine-2'-O-)-methyltransferase